MPRGEPRPDDRLGLTDLADPHAGGEEGRIPVGFLLRDERMRRRQAACGGHAERHQSEMASIEQSACRSHGSPLLLGGVSSAWRRSDERPGTPLYRPGAAFEEDLPLRHHA